MKKNNAKFAFYYLLSLVSLIFTSISSGIILFQVINRNISDNLLDYTNYINDGALRFAISSLIVAAPVLFLIIKLINKGLRKKEIEKDSPIRRWLTYFILFVSSVIILGSLIGVLNSFLSGEMTLKFILKILSLILISAIVFSYYFYDIKRENVEKSDKNLKIFFWLSLVFIISIFIIALFSVESPSVVRNRNIDQNTMRNVFNLESSINIYYEQNKKLPERIDDIESLSFPNLEYIKLDDENFKICAEFKLDSTEEQFKAYYEKRGFESGYNCFEGNLWVKDRFKISD